MVGKGRAVKAESRQALRQTFVAPVVGRSVVVAVVVGTLLNVINQGDRLVSGESLDWVKLVLTYMVPFCVASYGAYSALRQMHKKP